ncbi:hypothetical protein EVAR_99845_1 [Eumeta japonica]|uniref:Uncharacterized protein n=1 Tax=Eumeta variegata TaxID=151549 RepID=A0A4C2A1Z9_EUMVA|nr:hypothetical protein EVAR_99845_1 [Eumeta japonica]
MSKVQDSFLCATYRDSISTAAQITAVSSGGVRFRLGRRRSSPRRVSTAASGSVRRSSRSDGPADTATMNKEKALIFRISSEKNVKCLAYRTPIAVIPAGGAAKRHLQITLITFPCFSGYEICGAARGLRSSSSHKSSNIRVITKRGPRCVNINKIGPAPRRSGRLRRMLRNERSLPRVGAEPTRRPSRGEIPPILP